MAGLASRATIGFRRSNRRAQLELRDPYGHRGAVRAAGQLAMAFLQGIRPMSAQSQRSYVAEALVHFGAGWLVKALPVLNRRCPRGRRFA
jgi:hypothetical protein